MKYLYVKYCPRYAGIPLWASGMRHNLEGMKNVPASHKLNNKLVKRYCSFLISFIVPYRLLSRLGYIKVKEMQSHFDLLNNENCSIRRRLDHVHSSSSCKFLFFPVFLFCALNISVHILFFNFLSSHCLVYSFEFIYLFWNKIIRYLFQRFIQKVFFIVCSISRIQWFNSIQWYSSFMDLLTKCL